MTTPLPAPEADVEGALRAIESWCAATGTPLVLSVVPEDKAQTLCLRYPRCRVISERPWKDYLYRTEELAAFAGRRYSGQRNHINKFRRDYPDAEFTPLTDPPAIPAWPPFGRTMRPSFTSPAPWLCRSCLWHRRCSPASAPTGSVPAVCWQRGVWWLSAWRRNAAAPLSTTSKRPCTPMPGPILPWSRLSPPTTVGTAHGATGRMTPGTRASAPPSCNTCRITWAARSVSRRAPSWTPSRPSLPSKPIACP